MNNGIVELSTQFILFGYISFDFFESIYTFKFDRNGNPSLDEQDNESESSCYCECKTRGAKHHPLLLSIYIPFLSEESLVLRA